MGAWNIDCGYGEAVGVHGRPRCDDEYDTNDEHHEKNESYSKPQLAAAGIPRLLGRKLSVSKYSVRDAKLAATVAFAFSLQSRGHGMHILGMNLSFSYD